MDKATTIWYSEGTLNDNQLFQANNGYQFKGGYKYMLEYFTYLNSWGNKRNVKYFKSDTRMQQYMDKNFSNTGDWY